MSFQAVVLTILKQKINIFLNVCVVTFPSRGHCE
jgi:hypothetical protein